LSHSSARIKHFLALCAKDNIRVANCTTLAQYKPLANFTPKSPLRSPQAVSSFSELTDASFREVIGDTLDPSRIRKVVFCCGKIYYDLLAAREARHQEDVALVRVESSTRSPTGKWRTCWPVTVRM
jgi:2-oxoglutarate dehydrogenase E1 component